jgi:hypothetical protein
MDSGILELGGPPAACETPWPYWFSCSSSTKLYAFVGFVTYLRMEKVVGWRRIRSERGGIMVDVGVGVNREYRSNAVLYTRFVGIFWRAYEDARII